MIPPSRKLGGERVIFQFGYFVSDLAKSFLREFQRNIPILTCILVPAITVFAFKPYTDDSIVGVPKIII
jgi:hypothetical protein